MEWHVNWSLMGCWQVCYFWRDLSCQIIVPVKVQEDSETWKISRQSWEPNREEIQIHAKMLATAEILKFFLWFPPMEYQSKKPTIHSVKLQRGFPTSSSYQIPECVAWCDAEWALPQPSPSACEAPEHRHPVRGSLRVLWDDGTGTGLMETCWTANLNETETCVTCSFNTPHRDSSSFLRGHLLCLINALILHHYHATQSSK